jgi:hypothetical protein
MYNVQRIPAVHNIRTLYRALQQIIKHVRFTGTTAVHQPCTIYRTLRQFITRAQCAGHVHTHIHYTGHFGSSHTYIRTGHSGSSHTYTVHTQGTPALQTTYTLYRASDTHTHVHCTVTPVFHTHAQCTGRSGSSHTCTLGCTFSNFYTS